MPAYCGPAGDLPYPAVCKEPSKLAGKGKQSHEKRGNMADQAPGVAVLLFDGARLPCPLSDLPNQHAESSGDIAALLDALAPGHRRLVVIGEDAQLATVLSRLLRTDRADVG